MSHFYGTLQGCRGEASRCGSKNSGIETYAASWSGAIRVAIQHNEKTGEDTFYVIQTPWHGSGIDEEIASGVIGKHSSIAMINKILSHKEILPVLIGLDPELDKLIAERTGK